MPDGDATRSAPAAHALDFTGMSWVKMVVTETPANASNNVIIGEIDVHDISADRDRACPEDTWFFMGDSITAFAYDRAAPISPASPPAINTATSQAYLPAMINGGIGSELTATALARLDEALALNPDYRFFAISYGTNDSWDHSRRDAPSRTPADDDRQAQGRRARAGAPAHPVLARRHTQQRRPRSTP